MYAITEKCSTKGWIETEMTWARASARDRPYYIRKHATNASQYSRGDPLRSPWPGLSLETGLCALDGGAAGSLGLLLRLCRGLIGVVALLGRALEDVVGGIGSQRLDADQFPSLFAQAVEIATRERRIALIVALERLVALRRSTPAIINICDFICPLLCHTCAAPFWFSEKSRQMLVKPGRRSAPLLLTCEYIVVRACWRRPRRHIRCLRGPEQPFFSMPRTPVDERPFRSVDDEPTPGSTHKDNAGHRG